MRDFFISCFVIILLFIVNVPVDCCTVVMISKGNTVLAGNNEDFLLPLTKIWFVPASDNEYGRICFGFENIITVVQGGMNDQGFFLDANSVGKQGWKPDAGKPFAGITLFDYLLVHCSTVEEAIGYFKNHNVPGLDTARIPMADKTGASVVVEWAHGKVQYVRKTGAYQISTNFIISNFPSGNYPCWRYKKADEILSKADTYSVDLVRKVLEATHVQGKVNTLYSNICDLKNGIVYLYNFHNFDEPIVLNLTDELKKGSRMIPLYKLYSNHSSEYEKYLEEGPVHALKFSYYNGGAILMSIMYNKMKQYYPDYFGRPLDNKVLDQLGNVFIEDNKIDVALTVFQKSVKENPEAPFAYFSLANALLLKGDKDLAFFNYKKGLELSPYYRELRDILRLSYRPLFQLFR